MKNIKKWDSYVFVGFGITNILYALYGLKSLISVVIRFNRICTIHNKEQYPYLVHAFFTMTPSNTIFLVSMVFTGIYLIKRKPKAVLLCNIIFISEIIYFFSIGFVGWGMLGIIFPILGRSIAAASGIGNMGIALQIMTGYPIIALILLNISKNKIPFGSPIR